MAQGSSRRSRRTTPPRSCRGGGVDPGGRGAPGLREQSDAARARRRRARRRQRRHRPTSSPAVQALRRACPDLELRRGRRHLVELPRRRSRRRSRPRTARRSSSALARRRRPTSRSPTTSGVTAVVERAARRRWTPLGATARPPATRPAGVGDRAGRVRRRPRRGVRRDRRHPAARRARRRARHPRARLPVAVPAVRRDLHLGVRALPAGARRLPARRRRRARAQRPEPGHPLHPRRRRGRGLLAAAGRAVPRGARAASSTRATAMWRALRGVVEPIAASAGTVIAGLLCLLLSDLRPTAAWARSPRSASPRRFLAALTLLPALLLVGGRVRASLFWPRAPRPHVAACAHDGEHAHVDPTAEPTLPSAPGCGRGSRRFVGRAPRPVVGQHRPRAARRRARSCRRSRPAGTSETDVFLTEVDSVAGEDVLAEHFPAGAVQPAIVIVAEDDADAVVARPRASRGRRPCAPYTQARPPAAPAAPSAPPVVVDGRVRVDVVDRGRADTQAAVDDGRGPARRRARGRARRARRRRRGRDARHPGRQRARPAGHRAGRARWSSCSSSCCCCARSSPPLLLIAANVLSFAAALGVAALVFNHVLGFPGADPVVPLYAFVFLVALGIDYSIFLMTRVREEALAHRAPGRAWSAGSRSPAASSPARASCSRRRSRRSASSRCCSSRSSRSSSLSACSSTRSSCAACSCPALVHDVGRAPGGRARLAPAPTRTAAAAGADLG